MKIEPQRRKDRKGHEALLREDYCLCAYYMTSIIFEPRRQGDTEGHCVSPFHCDSVVQFFFKKTLRG